MFLRQTLLYLPAQVIGPIFQFLAVIAWTFWLAPAELGQLNLVIALQELLFLPTLYWWTHYTLRNLDSLATGTQRQAYERTELGVIGIGLVANALLMLASVLLFVDAKASTGLLAAAMAYGVSRSLLMVLIERARAMHQIVIYTVLQIAAAAGGLLVGLALVHGFGNRAVWPLIGFAVAQALAAFYVLPRVGLAWRRPALDPHIMRSALRYGAPLMLAGAITWVSLYGQRFIIDTMLDRAQVGLYSVGSGIADRSLMFIAFLVAPAIFPLAIRDAREAGMDKAMTRLTDGFALGLLLLVPAVTGLCLLAQPIATLLLGDAYRAAAVSLLPAAAIAAGLHSAWTLMPSQTLLLHRRTEFNVLIEGAGAVISIVLGLLLVRSHGVLGAAYARVGACAVVLILAVGVGVSTFHAVYPWRVLAGALAASAVMALVLQALPMPTTLLGLTGRIAIGGLVSTAVAGVLFWSRIKPVLDRSGLLQRFKRP